MTRIVWFNNPHEHHNDLLRLGLMRLHRRGSISYEERTLDECVDFGFSSTVSDHVHRRTSVILIDRDVGSVKCLVDSEDSFFWMSPLIREVDVYFCSGFNAAFFEKKSFESPYPWLRREETILYEKRAFELIEAFGDVFSRVRRYVPIGPELSYKGEISWWQQKARNAFHKARSRFGETLPWYFRYQDLEARYCSLLSLRDAALLYDVVLYDSLWGWPRHRYALHQRLKALAERYEIHSQLAWKDPIIIDGGDKEPLDRAQFPLCNGTIGDYEQMLASSRLAVLATGFHWGWRSIMMVALLFGLPVHADRLILEPWFDMDRFAISWNDTFDWCDLEDRLVAVSNEDWIEIKARNQRAYDEVMAPERVAEYFVAAAVKPESFDPAPFRLGKVC